MNWLPRHSDAIYSAMRVMVGFLFACHGVQKYFGILGGSAQIHTVKGVVAGTVEMIGGTLIALGLATSVAAFIAISVPPIISTDRKSTRLNSSH